jgi:hypothetical protein
VGAGALSVDVIQSELLKRASLNKLQINITGVYNPHPVCRLPLFCAMRIDFCNILYSVILRDEILESMFD